MEKDQLDIDFARAARDDGIQRAVDSANRKTPSWSEDAYRLFKIWLSHQKRGYCFLIEDFREYASDVLPEPRSKRAFGIIPVRAVKDGLIVQNGYQKVKNVKAHRCFATIWSKL